MNDLNGQRVALAQNIEAVSVGNLVEQVQRFVADAREKGCPDTAPVWVSAGRMGFLGEDATAVINADYASPSYMTFKVSTWWEEAVNPQATATNKGVK